MEKEDIHVLLRKIYAIFGEYGFFLQSIEYFMVDWRVDLWAVTHGGLTVILLI